MQLSAAVIAQTSGAAGLVAAGRVLKVPLKRLEVIDVGDGLVQLIAILENGFVRQARWRVGTTVDQESLDRIGLYVNNCLSETGRPPDALPADAGELTCEVLEAVDRLLALPAKSVEPRLYHAGLTQIMEEPEFSESDQLMGVVEILEHGQGLATIIERLPGSGVQVIIGGEPPLEEIPHVTLVLSRFGVRTTPHGVLGVVGPTRLAYERAVSTVGFVADLLTQLVTGDTPQSG
jgi:heat-inducible transcriptional repressor